MKPARVRSAGCVVPVNLELESAVPNSRPTIVGGDPDFRSPITPSKFTDAILFSVTARDVDVNDVLYAKLYRLVDGNNLLDSQVTITLTTTSADGVERNGSFAAYPWCQAWSQRGAQWFVTVYVSDIKFPDPVPPQPPPLLEVRVR